MDYQLHLDLMKIKERLREWSIIVYTGNQLDDIALMEIELEDIYMEKQLEQDEYIRMKMTLRRAYQALGGDGQN